MSDEYRPIHDPEKNRTITPNDLMKLLEEKSESVQVPLELLNLGDRPSFALETYLRLVVIAKQSSGQPAELPPQREFAKLVGCSRGSLIAALHWLHDTGWITITNIEQHGRIVRQRILVRALEKVLVDKSALFEVMTSLKDTISTIVKSVEGTGTTLHNIYPSQTKPASDVTQQSSGSFPPQLHELKLSARKRDKIGRTLAQFSDQQLLNLSGGASYTDIGIAIQEVETFDQPAELIHSIIALYKGRFVNGALNPSRRGKLFSKSSEPGKRYELSQSVEVQHKKALKESGCHIHPTNLFTAEEIDRLCERLNNREYIRTGELPAYMLSWKNGRTFVLHGDDHHLVKLHDALECVKEKKGYWKVQRIEGGTLCEAKERQSSSGPKLLSAILPNLDGHESNG